MSINYTDGTEIEEEIISLLRKSSAIKSTDSPGSDRYDTWPIRYHLSPERSNLLRHLEFAGLEVLELGAGMGGVSRLLAERASTLTVIEGTRTRFNGLCERLRDLDNWQGEVSNIFDVVHDKKYDVVCIVGVLEYSELFAPEVARSHPFDAFLVHAKNFLKPEGVMVLAIENRLGLKYWSGAAEDHTNGVFDGICGYSASLSARTFSRAELSALFKRYFSHLHFQYPFPDYKIPSVIIDDKMIDRWPTLAAEMATTESSQNYGAPNVKYFPELLAAHSVATAGLLGEFANSFLVFSWDGPSNSTIEQLLNRTRSDEVAWYYCYRPSLSTNTVFRVRNGELEVDKRELCFSDELEDPRPRQLDGGMVLWSPLSEPAQLGDKLRWELARSHYYDGWQAGERILIEYLKYAITYFHHDSETLRPDALDAVIRNAARPTDDEATFVWFDLEWEWHQPIPVSWFILRNVLALHRERKDLPTDLPFRNLKGIYLHFCGILGVANKLERDLQLETLLMTAIHGLQMARVLPWIINHRMHPMYYPRHPHQQDRAIRALLANPRLRSIRRTTSDLLRKLHVSA